MDILYIIYDVLCIILICTHSTYDRLWYRVCNSCPTALLRRCSSILFQRSLCVGALDCSLCAGVLVHSLQAAGHPGSTQGFSSRPLAHSLCVGVPVHSVEAASLRRDSRPSCSPTRSAYVFSPTLCRQALCVGVLVQTAHPRFLRRRSSSILFRRPLGVGALIQAARPFAVGGGLSA